MKSVSLPFQLLFVLLVTVFLGHTFSMYTLQLFLTLSNIFKECLGFLLPFIIFSFITTGILSFKKNAPVVLAVLLGCIIISNATVALASYLIGSSLLPFITDALTSGTIQAGQGIAPLFQLHLPRLISSEKAMLGAVATGISLSFFRISQIETFFISFKHTIVTIVNKLFIPILPLYVFGFLLDINHQGIFGQLFKSYGKTFTFIVFMQMLVLFSIYYLASWFDFKKTIMYIKNALPSYMTAFGTMSSTATIPVTIQCGIKNTHNQPLSEVATPILANVHLLGDAITTPTLALVTLFLFKGVVPDPITYITFVGYFCITMLAVSGIPGGGIIVMIPILKMLLGFSDEMISIITALYLLQDGLGTAGNVMGDGALMIIVNNILKKLKLA